uniref:Uncharacterized protein n=1 Tax=Aegilops tauschii subsp. strangulata TaxID=200361 RepID=A0A453GSX0_AEGTS
MTASTWHHHSDDPYMATWSWPNQCVLDGFPPVLAKPVDSSPTAPSDICKVHRTRLQLRHLQHRSFFLRPRLCAASSSTTTIPSTMTTSNHGYITIGDLSIDHTTTSTATHRQQLQSTASVSSPASTPLPLWLRGGIKKAGRHQKGTQSPP